MNKATNPRVRLVGGPNDGLDLVFNPADLAIEGGQIPAEIDATCRIDGVLCRDGTYHRTKQRRDGRTVYLWSAT